MAVTCRFWAAAFFSPGITVGGRSCSGRNTRFGFRIRPSPITWWRMEAPGIDWQKEFDQRLPKV